MSVQGLWTIDFQVPGVGRIGGVVVLQGNKALGGDSQYYYVGTYKETGDDVVAAVHCTHYAGDVSTAFGTSEKSYNLELEGRRSGNLVSGKIWRPEHPTQKLDVRLVRQTNGDQG